MKNILLLSIFLNACQINHVAKGHVTVSTESHADVSATVTFKIDVSACDGMDPDQRLQCIIAITDSLKEISDLAQVLACPKDSQSDNDCSSLEDVLTAAKELSSSSNK